MNIYYRKLLRAIGLIFPILYFFISKKSLLFFLFAVIIIFLFFELLRFEDIKINKKIFNYLKFILKEKEEIRISAITLFLLGAFFAILFFKKEIAILVLFFSVFGDSFATIIGKKHGRIWIGDKSLEGSLAFLTSCLAVGYILNYFLFVGPKIIIFGAIISTIVELIPLPIDDNLSIPIITGLLLNFIL